MEHYRCTTIIEGPAPAVYDALTTEAGIQSWWTRTCTVGKRIGGHMMFRFGETYKVMVIEKLSPAAEIQWRCLEHHQHATDEATAQNEWAGTSLLFRLSSQTPGRTLLEFEHAGLRPELRCYSRCERDWEHFLKRSLKNYVETGRGEPFAEISGSK